MDDEKNESLFKRLIARFHKIKLSKKITGLVLVTTLAVVLFMGKYIKQASNPNSNNNLGSIGDGETNENLDNNNENTNNENTNYSKYSKLLQNVLNNKHYDNLIAQGFSGKKEIYNDGAFKPHPYAFLEKEGFDIESIMSGETEAYTMSYVLDEEPNNLYMHTKILINDSYWTNYLLKYTLTDQEMDDYYAVHTGEGITHFYVQSVFMNNEISKNKTPEIVGYSKISAHSYSEMSKSMQDYIYTGKYFIIFLNPNTETNKFDLIAIQSYNDKHNMTFEGSFIKYTCDASMIFNGDVFEHPYLTGAFTPLNETIKEATFFRTQDVKLNQVHCNDFEQIDK